MTREGICSILLHLSGLQCSEIFGAGVKLGVSPPTAEATAVRAKPSPTTNAFPFLMIPPKRRSLEDAVHQAAPRHLEPGVIPESA